jgi:hypothetical protein
MDAALRWVVLSAVTAACAVDIVYVSQIIGPPGGRPDPLVWRSPFVGFLMAIVAALAVGPSTVGWRTLLLGLSAVGLVATGYLGGPYHYVCVDGKLTIRPGDCTHMGASMDPSGHVTADSDS